jgi:hypothetical protein
LCLWIALVDQKKMQTTAGVRRVRTIISHITPTLTLHHENHVAMANANSNFETDTLKHDHRSGERSGEVEQESTRPNIIPVALISQLNAITTKSFDILRGNLFENNKTGTILDIEELAYSLAQLAHHLTFFLSHDENRNLTEIGLKNSNYLASLLIIVSNTSLAILKYLQCNKKLKLSSKTERSLIILLQILTHIGSGLLQRNALVIIENSSATSRHQRLMTALYVLLITAAPLLTVPIQSTLIERYGLPTTLAFTSMFMLMTLPLFAFENVRELYGEKKMKDVKSPSGELEERKKKEHIRSILEQKSMVKKIVDFTKILSYLSLLSVTYSVKQVLQAQQYTSIIKQQQAQGTGQISARATASFFTMLSMAVSLIVTRALNLAIIFTRSSQKIPTGRSSPSGNIALLLLSQSASLLGVAFSHNYRLYPFYMAALGVSTSLLQHHLSREFLTSKDGKLVLQNEFLSKLRTIIIPMLSTIMPSLLALCSDIISKQGFSTIFKGETFRIPFTLLFIVQLLASIFFLI